MLIVFGKDILRILFLHTCVETNVADSTSDKYVPDRSEFSVSNSSDLSDDSASDYSSVSENSFSESEDKDDGVLMQFWARIYPPEDDIDFPSLL